MSDESKSRKDLSVRSAFAEHKVVLIAYMSKYLLKPEDVDDILQETFLKTLEASQKRKIQKPKAYLFIVARNLIFRKLRNSSKTVLKEISEVDERYLSSNDIPADVRLEDKMKMEAFMVAAEQLPCNVLQGSPVRTFHNTGHERAVSLGASGHFGHGRVTQGGFSARAGQQYIILRVIHNLLLQKSYEGNS